MYKQSTKLYSLNNLNGSTDCHYLHNKYYIGGHSLTCLNKGSINLKTNKTYIKLSPWTKCILQHGLASQKCKRKKW